MRSRMSLIFAALSLTAAIGLTGTASAAIAVGVSINVAPPELPVYEQPAVPGPGYLWSPGYWAWGGEDYYWVPGTWVLAPQPGYLWTPGYWGWGDGAYLWHAGYWGPHVGFYGGVNYGFGYGGDGYAGGEWRGGAFFYNRSVNNIPGSVHITNVYNRTVVNNVTVNRVSFNGGNGGIAARPSQGDLAAEREHHLPPVNDQVHHEQAARSEPALHAASNHGAPAIAATAHAGSFSGPGIVGAHGAGAVAPHPAPHGAGAPAGAHAETLAHPPGGGAPAGAPHAPHAPQPPQHNEPHGQPQAQHKEPPAHEEHEHEQH
jgi:hypothetical protein